MKPRSKRNRKRARKNKDDNANIKYTFRLQPLFQQKPKTTTTTNHHHNEEETNHPNSRMRTVVRTVDPYPYTYSTYAKARWIGRTLYDVYCTEFGSYPPSYYQTAIARGTITVSSSSVSPDYKIQMHDVLQHTVHRHEPAVLLLLSSSSLSNHHQDTTTINDSSSSSSLIPIVAETNDLLVVDKPPTLPVHPCGAYQQNSLVTLLEREQQQQKLYIIQRLDRLTSGLVLLAKSSTIATKWGNVLMRKSSTATVGHQCQKIYLARVKGQFPKNVSKMILPRIFHHHSNTTTSTTIIIKDGVVIMSSSDNNNKQDNNNNDVDDVRRRQNAYGYWITTTDNNGGSSSSIGKTTIEDDNNDTKDDNLLLLKQVFNSRHNLNDWLTTTPTTTNKEKSNNNNSDDTNTTAPSSSSSSVDSSSSSSCYWFHIASPCRIVNHKDGICETGTFDTLKEDDDDDALLLYRKSVKPAQTSFGVVQYDVVTDTTLLLCRPQTGRTHQIRLHLQACGHPIANDVVYGGSDDNNDDVLWYGDNNNKAKKEEMEWARKELLKQQQQRRQVQTQQQQQQQDGNTNLTTITKIATIADTPATEDEIMAIHNNNKCIPRSNNESLEDFIQRTCVWCARSSSSSSGSGGGIVADAERARLELLVRSHGIWLHALRYQMKITTTTSSDDGKKEVVEELDYCTKLPTWASF